MSQERKRNIYYRFSQGHKGVSQKKKKKWPDT